MSEGEINKKRRIPFNLKSNLFVKKVIGRFQDEFGRVVIKTQWFKVGDDIKEMNFGSVNMPRNEDIIEYKYEIPDPDAVNPNDFLMGLFGKK